MISILKGQVEKIVVGDKYNMVDVLTDSGVGYRVIVLAKDSYVQGNLVKLFTSFQVREDSQTLYGFATESVRDFFELLLTVSGIGPKIAIAVLSAYSVDDVASFVVNKDHQSLSKVSGLGSKGAQKIVVDLENRLTGLDLKLSKSGVGGNLMHRELSEALKSLGFSGEALKGYLEKAENLLIK